MRLRSTNPVFRGVTRSDVFSTDDASTYTGIIVKTLFLFLVLVTTGYYTISNATFFLENYWILIAALIVGLVAVIVSMSKPSIAKFTAPVYAAVEGVVLGIFILFAEALYSGIAFNALFITIAIFLTMLALYATGLVRVGPMFRRVLMGALIGLVVFTFAVMIISMFSPGFRESYFGNLNLLLLVSLISAGLASLFILMDLDNCSMIVKQGLPKEYEWVAGLGLMVTIVWLFIEILRILMIFASRRR